MEDLRSVLKLDEHAKGGAIDLSAKNVNRIDGAVDAALTEEGGAERLLSLLGLPQSVVVNGSNPTAEYDVVVILGADYADAQATP